MNKTEKMTDTQKSSTNEETAVKNSETSGRKSQKRSMKLLVMAAMLTALCCVATLSIRIPIPSTNGYIHPGDAFVILSGVILGPGWGFLAAGVGSALADLLGGYAFYAPGTFLIKGVIALISAFAYRRFSKTAKTRTLGVALGGVADMVCVTGGYLLYETALFGFATAATAIPASLVQSGGGLILAMILYPILFAIPDVRQVASEIR